MTDIELLKKAIERSGLKISFIADKMGISRQAFHVKLKSSHTFRANEILNLSKILNLSFEEREKIFFAQNVDINANNKVII